MKKSRVLLITFLFSLLQLSFAQEKELKVGLVLSGGGAKGYAHIGVLKALEESGVKIDYIGGTSMGAIVGALYASGYSADQLEELIKTIDLNQAIFEEINREKTPLYSKVHEEKYILSLEFDNLKLKLPTAISSGQGTLDVLTEALSHVHGVEDFDDLPIPFLCIATNIETGEQKLFKSGFLPKIVMASGAYPTLFNPVQIEDSYYVDGGVVNNYPSKEVLDMGANYLIGVDLGAGLNNYEEITNATGIIEQIISFNIESKTEEQRKLIDLPIIPDVKKISVTNFELKDSILQEGYKAAVALKPIFDSLRRVQGFRHVTKPLKKDSVFVINNIEFNGLEQYSEGYVLGKLGLEPSQEVTYDDIRNGVSFLYASQNFDKIEHRITNNEAGDKTLILDFSEKKNKFYLRFGLHYDELFKSSLLVNFTAKNLLTINSTLSIDAIFGDNPRFNINYFVNNGIRPSFGFNSYYYNFDIEKLQVVNSEGNDLSYNYKFRNFINQVYTQSTLAENYAVGIGLEYNYMKIHTNNIASSNPLRTLQDSYFLIPLAFLKVDNRDNSFFPTSGTYLDSQFRYFVTSKEPEFQPVSMLKTYAEYNQTFFSKFAVQVSGTLGLSFEHKLPNGYNFLIGGQNHHKLANSYNFYGLPFSSYLGNNLVGIGTSFQYRFYENHFLKYDFNAAHLSDSFDFIDTLTFEHTGHGVTYGYLSPLGPIQGSLSYSPSHRKIIPYISLGYWF